MIATIYNIKIIDFILLCLIQKYKSVQSEVTVHKDKFDVNNCTTSVTEDYGKLAREIESAPKVFLSS